MNDYTYIEEYATKKQLCNTLVSLKMVREMMGNGQEIQEMDINGITRFRGHYQHALDVCKLLISLVLPLNPEEEDIVLAAALGHVLPNLTDYTQDSIRYRSFHQMDTRIHEIISLIINDTDLSQNGQKDFYSRIQNNRLALLVFLADRANLVQQLYSMSMWSANEYIFETRTFFFPLCLYARETYPEFSSIVSILMEKVRTLVDACAILIRRYETREMEITEDILRYQEENSRLRSAIKNRKTSTSSCPSMIG